MTQESPLRLCYECRTPLGRPAATVRSEYFCADCAVDAVRAAFDDA